MEGVWETQRGAPFLLFALPDEHARTNRGALAIPNAASLVLTHDLHGEVVGLNEFAPDHPPVAPVFFAFRIMLGVGVAMLFTAFWGLYHTVWRRRLSPRGLLLYVAMTFSGWIATIAGWYVTEIGRQPYLITGVMTTAEAVTNQPATYVGVSLAVYLTVYTFLLVSYIATLFYLARQSARLEAPEPTPAPLARGTAGAPA